MQHPNLSYTKNTIKFAVITEDLLDSLFIEKICQLLLSLLAAAVTGPFSILSGSPWGSVSQASAPPWIIGEGGEWSIHRHSSHFSACYVLSVLHSLWWSVGECSLGETLEAIEGNFFF